MILVTLTLNFSVNAAIVYNRPERYEDYPSLLNIFTRKQKFWPDGSKIVVFIKPINSIEHKFFVVEWLGVSPTKYKQLLDTAGYSGDSSYVNEVESDDAMLLSVATTPNSIGYLDNKILVRGEKNVKIFTR